LGDLMQNKVVPGIANDGGTPSSWLAAQDKLAPLNVGLRRQTTQR
jgi:hypothetical protein